MLGKLGEISGVVASFLAIGTFLDFAFLNGRNKKHISRLLTKAIQKNVSTETRYLGILKAAYEAVFSKWFGKKQFSVRYFVRCAMLSTPLFIVLLAWQYFQFPDQFAKIINSPFLVLIVAVFFAFTLIVDWLSFAVTQVFFEVALSSKKFTHAVVLIACDVIVSINLFALVFSQFAANLFFLDSQLPLKSRITSTYFFTNELDSKQMDSLSLSNYRGSSGAKFLSFQFFFDDPSGKVNRLEQPKILQINSDARDMSLSDFLSAWDVSGGASIKTTFGVTRSSLVSDTGDMVVEGKSFAEAFTIVEKGSPKADEIYYLSEDIQIATNWMPGSPSRSEYYTITYNHADTVQDNFPGSLGFSPISMNYRRILEQVNSISYFGKIFGCRDSASTKWKIVDAEAINNKECRNVFVAEAAGVATLISAMRLQTSWLAELDLPLTPFFLTSLFLTLLIYSVLLGLVLAQQAVYLGILRNRWFVIAFSKAPFATTGLLFGVLLTVLGLLF